MNSALARLGGIFFIASADVGLAIYNRYAVEQHGPPVSSRCSLDRSFSRTHNRATCPENFEQKLHEQVLWWVALGVYAACTLFAVLFNIFNY
ncbi:rhomboid protease [Caerostris extrusa]|uniref:Rhomboid protease n=1 Tax=Caerostris extrusa TaxID=172846 RepID=A0AAV4N5H5_CAEEX|nr:rhomboid protease [Caerostris extrusa]